MTEAGNAPRFSWTKLIIRLERISAWILFFAFIAFGVTGYSMVKGILPGDFARPLHLGWLGAIVLVPFIIHTSWGVRLSLGRSNMWNRAAKIVLVAFYAALVVFFLWAEFFYSANKSEIPKAYPPVAENASDSGIAANSADDSATTVFTTETLKAYDGLGGQMAYAAVDGGVYDFSETFVNGPHKSHRAD